MAFTSGLQYAGSNSDHAIQIQVRGGHVRSMPLYDRPGDDMQENKGDLWEFNFRLFGFPFSCIRMSDIQSVSIIEGGNDGLSLSQPW